jgi:redox-sensitive bicupin YhaK (pirin superfamily)
VTTQSGAARLEVTVSHHAEVGRFGVRRALPRRGRRSVGSWCFADHMGPAPVTDEHGLDIGPHPHCGLQTVTWLIDGQALHRDSLGSEQVITPGQLNLMTAGHGVAHSEEATGHYHGELQGIQLWIALPQSTRDLEPAFEHHAALPQVDLGGGAATVLVGEFSGLISPARHDTALVGVDLDVRRSTELPLRPDFEHAFIVIEGSIAVNGTPLEPGHLGYLPTGLDEIGIDVLAPTKVILLGGVPLDETLLMWWNFVARTRDEIDAAYASWLRPDGRFGDVASPLARIDTPAPYWQSPPGPRAIDAGHPAT